MDNTILNILADDKNLVIYRPVLRNLTGSVTSAILLQQMLYWHKAKGGKEFYKFRKPCNHKLYQPGQSWVESLGFGATEFDAALRRIGTKIQKGSNKADILAGTHLKNVVLFYTDASRVTWYQLNEPLVALFIEAVYKANSDIMNYLSKTANPNYLIIEELATINKIRLPELPINIDNQRLPDNNNLKPEPKPNGKKPAAPKVSQDDLRAMVDAMAQACGLDVSLSFAKLTRNAKKLILAGYTPQDISKHFGRGGAWGKEFPGNRGNLPLQGQIVDRLPRYTGQLQTKQNQQKPPSLEPDKRLPMDITAIWDKLSNAQKEFCNNNPGNQAALKIIINQVKEFA